MRFWWLVDSRRLGVERRAVEELAELEDWFSLDRWCFHERRFCAVGKITAHGFQYPIRLLYPDQFPDVPAWVEPQDDVKWSDHQYGKGGSLCLELRPDNWNASATGADMLRSAFNLLEKENPLGTGGERASSAHRVGELQTYDWGAHPVLISAACRDRIVAGTARDPKAISWMASDDVWPMLIHDADDREGLRRPPGTDVQSWRFELPVHVSRNAAPATKVDRAGLIEAASLEAEAGAALAGTDPAVVVFAGGSEVEAYSLSTDKAPSWRRIYALPHESDIRSGRSDAARDKRVAIVGTGSVGSKVAEILVRSGIGRFTLVDGDVLLPANLERHALDWRDVGFRKAYGLKRRLLHIASGVEVAVVDANLNWQRSAKVHEQQVSAIAECDLIVDATGDVATSLFLGAVAHANDKPFVSAEVFEGGIGALVATALPDRDPPFAYGRAAFLAWCEAQNEKPPEPGPRSYEALAEDGTPIVADDAAVTMTASHAARVVLDILDGRPAPLEAAWLLLGYAKAWVFKGGHGHTIKLSVGPRRDQPSEDDPAAREFVLGLLKERKNESPSAT